MTTAFVAAHPDLIWLHAAAASRNGAAILLAGPAGAGKSTLLVRLVERGWDLFADDVLALRPTGGEALPLPFSPEVRVIPRAPEQDWPAFLEQPKALFTIAPDRVASKPARVAAIVFPEYACRPRPTARHAADSRVGDTGAGDAGARCPPRRRNIGELFRLARQIPCYRLRYADSSAAAGELASLGLLQGLSIVQFLIPSDAPALEPALHPPPALDLPPLVASSPDRAPGVCHIGAAGGGRPDRGLGPASTRHTTRLADGAGDERHPGRRTAVAPAARGCDSTACPATLDGADPLRTGGCRGIERDRGGDRRPTGARRPLGPRSNGPTSGTTRRQAI